MFTSCVRWEKLKSWRHIQSSILSKLGRDETDDNQDLQIIHGLKVTHCVALTLQINYMRNRIIRRSLPLSLFIV